MTSTTTPSAIPSFVNELIPWMIQAFEDGMKQAARILWDVLMVILSEHWLAVMIIVFVIFVFVTLKAMMGRWGSFGSFVYNFLYFGILFVIGLVRGPEVFVSDFFQVAVAVILYPVCYLATGFILDKTGLRRY
ncbi:MAG: hypothetical protein PHT44_00050 [Candidatus Portnoybacteria bacterium]|nr:hypothetical protein [Candidatus Portnoybacteria bacterium]MDD4982988.1 hypothetical protein [Candidatus Portnoybacteria bacterium]